MSKQIKIGYYEDSFRKATYKVISVKNTTDHLPGEILSKQAVEELCASNRWDVTIVPLNVSA
jgi:hypothetical protein